MPKIFDTRDYSKFKLISSNRKIISNEALEHQILNGRNKLSTNPIVIDTNYNIIDGQHRFHIAKKHGLKLYYIIDPDASVDDISAINSCQRNWKLTDYLHHYVEREYPEYIFLQNLMEKYDINLSSAVKYLCENSSAYNSASKLFKEGKYKPYKSREKTKEICKQIHEILNLAPSDLKRRARYKHEQALITLLKHPKYNHEHFMRKIEKNMDGLTESFQYNLSTNILNCLLDKVYNRYATKNKLRF